MVTNRRRIPEVSNKTVFNYMVSQGGNQFGIQTSGTGATVATKFYKNMSTATPLTGTCLSMVFSLDQVEVCLDGTQLLGIPTNGLNSYTTMYDEYRIDAIEVYTYINGVVNGHRDTAMPILASVVDTDDNQPLNHASIQEYGNCEMHQMVPGSPTYTKFQPAVNQAVYVNDGGTLGKGRTFSPTLDINSSSVVHYGYKAVPFAFGASAATICLIDFRIRMHVTFFGQR